MTGPTDPAGGRLPRVDRRTFLTGGLKLGATLGAAGAVVGAAGPIRSAPAFGAPAGAGAAPSGHPGAPTALQTDGATAPVGVDPDRVTFAWGVSDPRPGAVQGAYRVRLTGPAAGAAGAGAGGRATDATLWDSGPVPTDRQAFIPYAGPALAADTLHHWTVQTADGAGRWGPQSPAAAFRTGLRAADWSARWLRPGPAGPVEEAYTYLRTERSLPAGTVAHATAYVAAAHKYQLWVNGERVDTGPSFCFPDEQYYQATDVTGAVAPGRANAVGVLHHWYGPGRGRPASSPGILAQVAVHYTDGRVVTLATDGTWRTRAGEWQPAPQRNNDAGDFVEWIDGRLHPGGWSTAGFDDRRWAPAAVLGPVGTAPFTALYAQRTAITELSVPPMSVRTLPTGSVVADFGRVYAGRPTVLFRAGTDGHTVPLHVGYSLDPDGSVSTTHNTQGTDLSFSYTQRDGTQLFDPYWYLGFRYLQIDDPGEPVAAHQVTLVARHATMPDGPAAAFSSSDPILDAVWDLCAHSGLYTSQEQFIDTPTREKGQFLWDAANESQTMMRSRGEQNLTAQGLRDQARAQARYWAATGEVNEIYPNDDGPQDYPIFTALYPEWIWRYYLSTGDLATVTGLLPTLRRLSDYLASTVDTATGLISDQPMSTNGDNEYGYDYQTAADTTLNVLAVNAHRRVGAVAALAGDGATVDTASLRAAALAAAVDGLLVSPDGLYVDGLRGDGTQSGHRSQLANLTALAYGVVPPSRVGGVAAHVSALDISVEPDHGMELLRALHASGRDADVVRLLTDASFPGWAAILRAGGTFTWETWTPSDLIGDSMSHGWGSSALVAIQEALLGAVPLAPSGGTTTQLAVTPPSGGLTHATGTVPSPAGPYAVAWRRTGGRLLVSVEVPPNAVAHCTFAGATADGVTEGGAPVRAVAGVRAVTSGAATVTVTVGGGRYSFAAPAG